MYQIFKAILVLILMLLILDKSFVNCLMYTDDLVLIFCSEVGLQGLIDNLGDYCKR